MIYYINYHKKFYYNIFFLFDFFKVKKFIHFLNVKFNMNISYYIYFI